jgi:hypothetical protein
MKLCRFSEIKKFFTVVISFAAVIFLFSQPLAACSWDYLIWQNRSKNSEPYYRFIKNGKAGFIDRSGKVFIEPKLEAYGNYQVGIINGLLKTDFDKYVDVKTGKEVSSEFYYRNTETFEGLAVERFADKFGFVDRGGSTVIKPNFIFAKNFSEGFAPVVVDGPCYYYDAESPCPEGSVLPVGTKTQPVNACKFNFIDKKGNLISAQTFFDIKDFSEGLAPVKTEEGWGYIDANGNLVIAPGFEEAHPFSEGLALVKVNKLYGYINAGGAFAIEPQFKRAESFSDNLAPVGDYGGETVNNKFYYIDKSGKPAAREKFLLASRYFKGLAHVLVSETFDKESKIRKRAYAYINEKGKKVFVYTIAEEM